MVRTDDAGCGLLILYANLRQVRLAVTGTTSAHQNLR